MNQEQNNLNQNNFNTQGNNGIPNNQPLNNQNFNQSMGFNQQPINPQPHPTPSFQQPINQMNMQQSTPQPMNTFESDNANNQSFNNKPQKKMNLGLIIGIVAAVIVAVIGGVLLISNMNGNTNNDTSNGNSNNGNSNVDLTIDESVPKSLTCNLVGNAIYGEKASYSYEYILPNWNRYTFLKEYEPEYTNEPGKIYVVDYDKVCKENRKVDNSNVDTNDFGLYIHYSVDKYSSASYANIKERATNHLGYTQAGSPTLYGNDNGYWYAYMDKGYNLKTNEDDLDELNVHIWKEVAKFENAHKTPMGNNIVGDEYHALEITIRAWYENETGKIRLNYLLNDLKEMLEEKYDLDLSKLTVDMIKK